MAVLIECVQSHKYSESSSMNACIGFSIVSVNECLLDQDMMIHKCMQGLSQLSMTIMSMHDAHMHKHTHSRLQI